MILSAEQDRAVKAVDRWYKAGGVEPFELHGLAGTGKTTLARYFAEHVEGVVKFAAYTGKAASVLRKKGCPGATTIHSLIYNPVGNTNVREMRELEALVEGEMDIPYEDRRHDLLESWRSQLEDLRKRSRAMFEVKGNEDAEICEADLVIIDERSMVGETEQRDLMSFGVPILFLGDPGQLPPVQGRSLAPEVPDFMLTEIHRQAADSAIIRLAYDFRNGKFPTFGEYGEGVEILRKRDWDWQRAVEADQVIVGMNATRHSINRGMRARLGYKKLYPEAGERLICLQNNHEVGLLNGVVGTSLREAVKSRATVDLVIDYEGQKLAVTSDAGHFEENYGKRKSYPGSHAEIEHFDYGYGITGHKSQGSQWRNVLICDDKMRANDIAQRKKWLYTVTTRAEEQLTIYA